jgi:Asp-tRNA(Asn)/Glu-tRNA(Gln) amidotransferase C subunit
MRVVAVDAELIRTLSRLTNLDIPEDDLVPLAEAMRKHLTAMAVLDQVDLAEVESPLEWGATWDE